MKVKMNSFCLTTVIIAASICGCSKENPRVTTRLNAEASLTGSLPWNPLQGRVITSWIDPGNATMSTLYGNDAAIKYARTNSQHAYPAGAILSLVTWKQQEDERWFGAKIPAAPQSVEFVTVGSAPDHSVTYSYKEFRGKPLQLTSAADTSAPDDRATYLLSQRAMVMP
jgi:hypothetical protein